MASTSTHNKMMMIDTLGKVPPLPHDLVIEILAKLPVRSLLRFKAVRKSWRNTIENPQFVRQQLRYSGRGEKVFLIGRPFSNDIIPVSFYEVSRTSIRNLHPPLRTMYGLKFIDVYSCHGILLLVERFTNVMFLWNPSTKKFREIQHPGYPSVPISNWDLVHGFGYDSYLEDYRIVRIGVKISEDKPHQVLVFSSKSNSWKTIQKFPKHYVISPSQAKSNAFINDAVHFVAYNFVENKYLILSLSLDGERIREFLPPPPVKSPGPESYTETLYPRGGGFRTMVCVGRLCLQGAVFESERSWVDSTLVIWSMEKYGDSNSWTRILSVPYSCYSGPFVPLSLMQNGDLLVRVHCDMYLHEMKSDTKKKFPQGMDCHYFCGVQTYTESLVCP